jgi:hypothetical protein
MAVKARIGATDRPITAHDVAVSMLCRIGTDHAIPSLRVATLQQVAALGNPRQYIILAVI